MKREVHTFRLKPVREQIIEVENVIDVLDTAFKNNEVYITILLDKEIDNGTKKYKFILVPSNDDFEYSSGMNFVGSITTVGTGEIVNLFYKVIE